MQIKKKLLLIFGTRPEAIKMAPVFNILNNNINFNVKTCVTGQHQEMLHQVLQLFNIIPDYNLKVMQDNQGLSSLTALILTKLENVIKDFMPDIILVHGDTTTTMAASLAAFYHKIKVGHVEAGLRTHNKYSPWPEELNRKITANIADFHFCPTQIAKQNLIHEGYKQNIYIVGNSVIDALFYIKDKINQDIKLKNNLQQKFSFLNNLDKDKKLILVTAHRREIFGNDIISICNALKNIASNKKEQIQIIYPVHLNPNINQPVYNILQQIENVFLLPPLEYLEFTYLMLNSYIILTDSGGIQEEAAALGKPVLIMRNTTERLESIQAGIAKLVGTNQDNICTQVYSLLDNKKYYNNMSKVCYIYGDGSTAQQICNILLNDIDR